MENIKKQSFLVFFLLTELAIYATYLVFDLNNINSAASSILKWSSICICYFIIEGSNTTIKIAMFLTVIADFLLVGTQHFELGILIFLFVQLQYYRHIMSLEYYPIDHLALMTILGGILSLLVNFIIAPINLQVFLAMTYLSTLVTNIILCYKKSYESQNYKILFIALILVVLCDIHVGVTNIFNSGIWYTFGTIAMWLFYLPSQVIIALLYYTNNRN